MLPSSMKPSTRLRYYGPVLSHKRVMPTPAHSLHVPRNTRQDGTCRSHILWAGENLFGRLLTQSNQTEYEKNPQKDHQHPKGTGEEREEEPTTVLAGGEWGGGGGRRGHQKVTQSTGVGAFFFTTPAWHRGVVAFICFCRIINSFKTIRLI